MDRAALDGCRLLICTAPGFGIAHVVRAWATRTGEQGIPIFHSPAVAADCLPAWLAELPTGPAVVTVESFGKLPQVDQWQSVGAAHVAFDAAEVAALLENSPGSDSLGADVWAMTAGWPSLVAVAVAAVRSHAISFGGADGDLLAELAQQAVCERLSRDLSPQLPRAWLPMLRYLAVAGKATPLELAQIDPGEPRRHLLLAALGLITSRTEHRETLVQLHPGLARVVADGLQSQDPAAIGELRRQIATVRLAHGIVDCGIIAAWDLQDWELCARIIDRWTVERLLFGPYRDIAAQVLPRIPQSYYRAYRCLAHRAEVYLIVPLGSVEVQIPRGTVAIHEAFRRDGGASTLRSTLIAISGRRFWGRIAEAHQLALQVEPQADMVTERNTPSAGVLSWWYMQAGLTCQVAGDDDGARRMYESGWRARTWDATEFAAKDVAAKHAALRAYRGERSAATRLLEEARKLPECSEYPDTTIAGTMSVAEAILALDDDQDEAAWRLLAETDAMISRDELWPYHVWAQARFEIRNDNPLAVLDLVNHARRKYPETAEFPGFHRQLLEVLLAEARLAMGHGTNAKAGLDTIPDSFALAWPTRIRLCLLTGQPGAAATLAAEFLTRGSAPPRVATEIAVLHAAALVLSGQEQAGAESARRAASLIQRWQLACVLRGLPSDVAERLAVLVPALRTYIPATASPGRPATVQLVTLTHRENLVLQGLAARLTQRALASQLFVSPNTVKTQVRSLYAKLGADSRETAIARASELGLLPGD